MQYLGDQVAQTKEQRRHQINEDKMCLESFVLRLKTEITSCCQIPLNIPDKQIFNIIEQCKSWFYEHYEYSVEESYLCLSNEIFQTPEFKYSGSVKLPKEVFSVYGVYKVDLGHVSSMWDYVKLGLNFPANSLTVVNDDLMWFVLQDYYLSFRDQMMTDKYMRWSYNELTNNFKVMGATPQYDVVLAVYKKIPDCALFRNDKFFEYVTAKCYKNLAKILGLFNFSLPGSIQINYDNLASMGQDIIDKIEDDIKTGEGTDFFMMS